MLWMTAAPRCAPAQSLPLSEPLLELDTLHFAIYFPAVLEPEGRRLALYADAAFDELSGLFGRDAAEAGRIPVLLCDGQAGLNGEYSPYPSNRILIQAAPASLGSELGSLEDPLKDVFYHELAHALSFANRSPFWRTAASVFGDPVEPGLWQASPALAEGAAMYAESLPGRAGRDGDPLALARLRQDLLEGREKSFWQASGAWDAYPYGSLPYDYGGPFVLDLIRQHGQAAFADLWRRIGEGGLLGAAFRATYGESVDAAWSGFLGRAALSVPVVMQTERLSAQPASITAIAAGRDRLFWAEDSRGWLFAYDLASGRVRRVMRVDGSVNRIDVSADGETLLLSYSRTVAGREHNLAAAWSVSRGRRVGPELWGLREAAFCGGSAAEGVVALDGEGLASDLVLVSGTTRRLLLKGGAERSYGSPVSPDGRRVYALARDQGRTLLLRLDLTSGREEALAPGLALEHLRSLALAADGPGTRLVLTVASGEGLYRLALLDDVESSGTEGGAPRLAVQEVQLSGSVLQAGQAGDSSVYYLGRFSDGEYPCRFPLKNPSLALTEGGAQWIPLDPSFELPKDEAGAAMALEAGTGPAAQDQPQVRRATPFPALARPFRFPSLSPDLDAAGVDLVGSDIAQRLVYATRLQYSWAAQAANVAARLRLGLRPWNLGLGLEDDFTPGAGGYERRSQAGLDLVRSWELFPAWRTVEVDARADLAGVAPLNGAAPYQAPYSTRGGAVGLLCRYDSRTGAYFPPFVESGGGAQLALDMEEDFGGSREPTALALETEVDGSMPFLGLCATASFALSPDGSIGFGPRSLGRAGAGGSAGGDSPSILQPRYAIYREYGEIAPRGPWYASGDVSALLADFELQRRPLGGPLYFQRARLRLGMRSAALGAPESPGSFGPAWFTAEPEILSSAYTRLDLRASPLLGMAVEARFAAAVELSYAFNAEGASPLGLTMTLGLMY